MVTHKLRLLSFKHINCTKIFQVVFFLLTVQSAGATSIKLPQGHEFDLVENWQLLKLEQKPEFDRRGFLYSLEEVEDSSITTSANNKSLPVFSSYLAIHNSVQKVANNKGALSIHVFSSKEYSQLRYSSWNFDNFYTRNKSTDCNCDKGHGQCYLNSTNLTIPAHSKGNRGTTTSHYFRTESVGGYHFSSQEFHNLNLHDVNFFTPLITQERSTCQINHLTDRSKCELVSTVVMVFTPYDKGTLPTIVIHTINPKRLERIQSVKAEAEAFLQNIGEMRKTAEDFLAFRYIDIDKSIKEKHPNLPLAFYSIVRLYIAYFKEPGLFGETYNPTPVFEKLPEDPMPAEELLITSRALKSYEESKWKSGTASGSVYSGDTIKYSVQNQMHANHAHGNAIQRDLFPSGMYYEGNVVSSILDILSADQISNEERKPDAVITSGGTMSIKSALHAHYNLARANGIEKPEMILPTTAHPAHLRSDDNFVVRHTDIKNTGDSPTYTVDLEAVEKLINKNTVLLVGSAVNYPYGTMDPIEKLSELAEKYNKLESRTYNKIRVHVDACLGGFFLAFLDKKKHGFGEFDFRIPNVHTITIDTHKYGNALKGSSVVAFRTREVADHASFVDTEWLGGMYASANEEGSKSAGDYATAWAAMASYGKSGYEKRAEDLYEKAKEFADIIRATDDLEIMGQHSMCLAFKSKTDNSTGEPILNIGHIKDYMGSKVAKPRWRFNGLQYPDGLHFCITGPQLKDQNPEIAQRFTDDLKLAVQYAKTSEGKSPEGGNVYGASSVNISFEYPECKTAFIKAAGYLTRTVGNLEAQLEDFQSDMLRILDNSLGINPSYELSQCLVE